MPLRAVETVTLHTYALKLAPAIAAYHDVESDVQHIYCQHMTWLSCKKLWRIRTLEPTRNYSARLHSYTQLTPGARRADAYPCFSGIHISSRQSHGNYRYQPTAMPPRPLVGPSPCMWPVTRRLRLAAALSRAPSSAAH